MVNIREKNKTGGWRGVGGGGCVCVSGGRLGREVML